jgi:hypothetical protein
MHKKGLLNIDRMNGVQHFSAAIPKLELLATLVTSFYRDTLKYEGQIPAHAFSGSALLTEEEIGQFQFLLNARDRTDDCLLG